MYRIIISTTAKKYLSLIMPVLVFFIVVDVLCFGIMKFPVMSNDNKRIKENNDRIIESQTNQDNSGTIEKSIVDGVDENIFDWINSSSIYGDNYVFGLGDELVYETKSYGLTTFEAWFNPYEVFGGLMIKDYNGEKKMIFGSKGAREESIVRLNNIYIYNSLVIDNDNINLSSNYIPTFTLGKSLDGGGNYMQENSKYDICGSIKWFPFSNTVVDIFNDDAWESFGEKELTATWKFDECENYANYKYVCAVTGEEVKNKYNKYLKWLKGLRSIKFVYEDNIPKDFDHIGTIPNSNGLICVQRGSELTILALDKNKKIYLSQDASSLFSCMALGKRHIMNNCIIDLKNVDCSLVKNWTDTFLGCEDNVRGFDVDNVLEEDRNISSVDDIDKVVLNEIKQWLLPIIKKYNIKLNKVNSGKIEAIVRTNVAILSDLLAETLQNN